MPVWHKLTEKLRKSGDLVVIGITEEQHPDRCRLWAQWQGIDWPILWDPFNLTGSAAVPIVMAVDVNSVVQSTRLNPRKFEEQFMKEFMELEFPMQILTAANPHPGIREKECGPAAMVDSKIPLTSDQAISRFLWYEKVHGAPMPRAEMDFAVRSMTHESMTPAEAFRLGVAHRLRYDSAHHQAEDFQASIDHWMAALSANPGQYIWRRRIQQWGPRLDKPYPFYDWIPQAQTELRAQGKEPISIRVNLTGAEIAKGTREGLQFVGGEKHPDPDQKLPRDGDGFVALETASALHTDAASKGGKTSSRTARIHLVLRPNEKRQVHWTNDAGPTLVWINTPDGGTLEKNLFTLSMPKMVSSNEVRQLDFEIQLPVAAPETGKDSKNLAPPFVLRGVALYYVCVGESGECVYLAQDFEILIPLNAGKAAIR